MSNFFVQAKLNFKIREHERNMSTFIDYGTARLKKAQELVSDDRIITIFTYPDLASVPKIDLPYHQASGFLVFNMKHKRYVLFDDLESFEWWYTRQVEVEQQFLHETAFNVPQKIKIDIDMKSDKIDLLFNTTDLAGRRAVVEEILEKILSALKLCLSVIGIYSPDICICQSHCPDGKKWSYHIIVTDYYLSSPRQVFKLVESVLSQLEERYVKTIDSGVYRRTQNFRMALSCTLDGRRKVITTGHSLRQTLITYVEGCQLIDDIVNEEEVIFKKRDLSTEEEEGVIRVCEEAGLLEVHNYRRFDGKLYNFDRLYPSHCDQCNRIHDIDNTLIVSTKVEKCGYVEVFRSCRKLKKLRWIHVGGFGPENVKRDLSPQERYLHYLVNHMDREEDPFTGLNVVYYDEPTLRPYPLCKTLCVRAAMKMGKTKALRDYLDSHFRDELVSKRILFVSFRQTFTANLSSSFGEFTVYNTVTGPLDQDKLIVQVESLHRVQVESPVNPFDLVILDECESIFDQFDSRLSKNGQLSFRVFQWLMRYSSHVVCMDANLGVRTVNIVNQMRGGDDLVVHCNNYKNATDDYYFITSEKDVWTYKLYESLEADKKIVIPISSLQAARGIRLLIHDRFPDKKVKLYSSDSTNTEKTVDLASVNDKWNNFDVLIYTPTISAGVSFETHHYDVLFGFFIDSSCSAETCHQMMGRVRNLTDKEYNIYIDFTKGCLPDNREAVERALAYDRGLLMQDGNSIDIDFSFGPTGEWLPNRNDYYSVWMENTINKNLSRNDFAGRLLTIISKSGPSINIMDKNTDQGKLEFIRDISTEASKMSDLIVREEIASAPDLSTEEYNKISALSESATEDITVEQKRAMTKANLRMIYDYDGDITEDFVKIYGTKANIKRYKNLKQVAGFASLDDAVKNIKRHERVEFDVFREIERGSDIDLQKEYSFHRHLIALRLMSACMWTHLNDRGRRKYSTVYSGVKSLEPWLLRDIVIICNTVGIKNSQQRTVDRLVEIFDQREYVKLWSKLAGKILIAIYGVNIANDGYYLELRSKHFTISNGKVLLG